MVKRGAEQRELPKLSVILPLTYTTAYLYDILGVCEQLGAAEVLIIPAPDLQGEAQQVQRSTRLSCKLIPQEPDTSMFYGRFQGAAQATHEILLFLPEDQVLPANQLQRYLFPISYGTADGIVTQSMPQKRVAVLSASQASFSRLWNGLYERSDLGIASLIDLPHALTRKAVNMLEPATLAHPAEAYRRLLANGMTVSLQQFMPEGALSSSTAAAKPLPSTASSQPFRKRPFTPQLHGALLHELSTYQRRVVAEHLQAIRQLPPRAGLTDGGRDRSLMMSWRQDLEENRSVYRGKMYLPVTSLYGGQQLSVIIPARNEEAGIVQIIEEVKRLEPAEIIVIVNGTTDATARLARECGAMIIEFSHALGVDTGRAIGASLASGDILLFIDADVGVTAEALYPFALACQRGFDLALNDVSVFLPVQAVENLVISAFMALNLAVERLELGTASMTRVPFAMRRGLLEQIGWELMQVPPKAQVASALAGASIVLAAQVDTLTTNRFRPDKHLSVTPLSPAASQIIGDHIEAFHYLVEQTT